MTKYVLAIVALWAIAIGATLALVGDTGRFTYLGPIFFICLVGSIMVLRHARQGPGRGGNISG